MPATLMGRHWAVSGDLQGQVAAGQDPGGKQRTTQDHAHHTGPRPPHTGPRPPEAASAPTGQGET